jgi:Na+/proline symporter
MRVTGVYLYFDLLLLLLVLFYLCLFIYALNDLRGIKNGSLEESYALAKRSRENGPLIIGIVITDILIWTVLRASLEEKVSPFVLLWVTIGVDLFFGFFVVYRFVATALAKKRIRELEANTLDTSST